MLVHYSSHGDDFGRPEGSFPPKYLSLEQVQLRPRRHSSVTSTRKSSRSQKLRIITSPVAPAYRPSSTTTRTKKTKSIRPKQEQPPSPAMSGYSYSSSDQSSYSYQTSYPTPGVPQYTQSQINAYYAQYQQYPPQPYQIIPDYYTQPVAVTHTAGYQQPLPSGYDVGSWQSHGDDLGMSTSQVPTRSSSRTKTWMCDISGCSSSANFTRLADLQRHQSTVHGVGTPEYPCNVARCNRIGDKGFTRRDHLVEHLRNFHHIDIPKRRPGERSAFPFGWPEGTGGSHQDDGVSTGVTGGGEGARGQAGGSSQRVRVPDEVESGVIRASPRRSTTAAISTRNRHAGITRGRVAKAPSRRGGRAAGRSRGGSSSAGISRFSTSSLSALSLPTSASISSSWWDGHQEQGLHASSIQLQHGPPPQTQRHPLDLTDAELATQDMLLGLETGTGDLFGALAPDPETYPER